MEDKLEKKRLDELRKRYEDNPEDRENAISLAELYSDKGWLTESREIYESLYKKTPDDYSIILAYGNICFKKDEKETAVALFSKLTKLKPNRVEGWNNLGIAQVEDGDADSAYKSFMKILEIEPDNHGALLNLGNYFDNKGEFDKSSEYFKKVTEIRPDYRDGWFNYGNALLKNGSFKKAINAFERSLKYDPLFVSSLKNIGYVYELLGDNDKALNFYIKAIDQDRTDATIYSNIANVYLKLDRIDDASDFYKKAVSLAPRESTGWMGIRELSLLEGDMAIYAKSTLAVLHRLDADEIANAISALRKTGNYRSCNKIIKMAKKLNISSELFFVEQLMVLVQIEADSEITDNLYEKVMAIKGKSDEAVRALFYYCKFKGLSDKATRWYNKLNIKNVTDRIKFWDIKFNLKKDNSTINEVKSYLEENSSEYDAWFKLAEMYSLLGETKSANMAFETALKKGFTNEDMIMKSVDLSIHYKSEIDTTK